MISRVIVTTSPASVSQRNWDDFCQAQGLTLQPTGYFAANGLHAGCQSGRVSFFSRDAKAVMLLAANFLYMFGGQVAVSAARPVLVAAGA